ncbi:putative secreted protein [Parvularcula bermudensis HTCC2503]|uniref:D-amino-acid oxidase n=2 Tax=Parvularcula TaxID=208215 RepID=E0TE09_PARBH|nr:putative secreted protein [Parvularcula bermudensis HTCC2503]
MAACTTAPGAQQSALLGRGGATQPLIVAPHRRMRITVCTRPFRAAGPRLEAQRFGETTVIHNYGHGGSGWSLAWGSAHEATKLVMEERPSRVAVVGAGAIGLTTATYLAKLGIPTTIYAKEFPAETRSARATGTWSPDSRIALKGETGPDFPAMWERLARKSFATHQYYVGMTGHPVEFSYRYYLSDSAEPTPQSHSGAGPHFADYDDRLDDMTPPAEDLPRSAHSFPVVRARRRISMTFNVSEYSRRLLADYLAFGGRIERADFGSPDDVLALDETTIVNCTGYGARQLWGDDSLIPVRGQIGWLAPQPNALYGAYYNGVGVLSRRDGVILQVHGDTEAWGYQIDNEAPDREEFDRAIATIAPLFENWRG